MSTSTTSTSSSVPSFYTMDGTTRLNGSEFASGLDTQNLIKALTAKTSEKITKQQQLQQKVEWKQEMYHEIEDLLQSFSDNYLSYSTKSSTNLMSKRFFDAEQLVSSNSSVVTATGDAADAGNVVINSITKIATAATLSGSEVSMPNIHTSEALGKTVSSSSYLNVKVGETSYTISLGSNVELSCDDDGTISESSLQELVNNLNSQVEKVGLTGKIKFAVSDDSITMTSTDDSTKITGASQNFINGLGLKAQEDESGKVVSYTLDGPVKNSIAFIGSQLAGTSLTVQLDGLTKTISFNQSEAAQYEDAESLAKYLQGKFDNAFGVNKVKVDYSDSGVLSFSVADSSSVLTFVSASSSGVLGTNGLLHIRSGETNRLELDKKLSELTGELNTTLSTTAKDEKGKKAYSFTINGKSFTFNEDTELNTIINTINNDNDVNVTISYSQTLNRFRIVSDNTGSQETISISDNENGGNLVAALFGSNPSITNGQDLEMEVMLGGTATKITRGTNNFTLDGVTMTVTGTTNSTVTFSAADNSDDLYNKISTFVEDYNKIISKINTYVTEMPPSQSTSNGGGKTYEPLTDDQKKEMTDSEIEHWQKKAKQGLLFADPQLSQLQSDLRSAMETIVTSVGMSLADIGISTQAYDYTSGGKLVIDETKLKDALKNNLSKVEQIFTNSDGKDEPTDADGVAQRLSDVVTKYIGVYGNSGILVEVAGSNTLIGTDTSQFANQISQYQKNIKELQTRLTNERNRLQREFTQMENILSKLVTQFDYISNMGLGTS
jgi:flagellar hook-associated protein 2